MERKKMQRLLTKKNRSRLSKRRACPTWLSILNVDQHVGHFRPTDYQIALLARDDVHFEDERTRSSRSIPSYQNTESVLSPWNFCTKHPVHEGSRIHEADPREKYAQPPLNLFADHVFISDLYIQHRPADFYNEHLSFDQRRWSGFTVSGYNATRLICLVTVPRK